VGIWFCTARRRSLRRIDLACVSCALSRDWPAKGESGDEGASRDAGRCDGGRRSRRRRRRRPHRGKSDRLPGSSLSVDAGPRRVQGDDCQDGQSIDYQLSYDDLVGTVQQSHIHFAQKGVNGSIVIWLCQTATTSAPDSVKAITPMCPSPGGTVEGHITSANVIAAVTTSQMIVAGELGEVIAAIRAGVAYANVHATPLNPGGEIRGQLKTSHGHDHDDDHDHDGHK
jgi:hypothetical protein